MTLMQKGQPRHKRDVVTAANPFWPRKEQLLRHVVIHSVGGKRVAPECQRKKALFLLQEDHYGQRKGGDVLASTLRNRERLTETARGVTRTVSASKRATVAA